MPVAAVVAALASAAAAASIAVRQWIGPMPVDQPLLPAPPVAPPPPPPPATQPPSSTINWGDVTDAIISAGRALQRTQDMNAAQLEMEQMRREMASAIAVAAETERQGRQRTLLVMGAVGILAVGGIVLAWRK